MGISGLLRALQPYCEAVHVSQYAGQRVGIDGYSWLHKGAYSCSQQVCESQSGSDAAGAGGGSNGRTDGRRWGRSSSVPLYVTYFMHRVNLLKFHKVTPVVVFDGGRLPMKAGTEQERRQKRESYLSQARDKLARGESKGVEEMFQRAITVTSEMAKAVIQALEAEGVEFQVAPYEADAQLAWLARGDGVGAGGVIAVISEDSDLLAYGCPKVIFKMDRLGNGEQLSLDRMFTSPTPPKAEISLLGFDLDLFLGMCVLSGCDFLPSIPGIGVKRAHKAVAKFKSISRALTRIKYEIKSGCPPGYEERFWRARATFLHARVYDSTSGSLRFLSPIPIELRAKIGEEDSFLGPFLSPSIAQGIAEGRLNPNTQQPFESGDATWHTASGMEGSGGSTGEGDEESKPPPSQNPIALKQKESGNEADTAPPERSNLSAFATFTSHHVPPSRPSLLPHSKRTPLVSPPLHAIKSLPSKPTFSIRDLLRKRTNSTLDGSKECSSSSPQSLGSDPLPRPLAPQPFKKLKVERSSGVGGEVAKGNWLRQISKRKVARLK